MGREAFKSTPAMATTTTITIATGVMANARNYGQLVCTRRRWASKVRETADDIAKCAGEDSFAIRGAHTRPHLVNFPPRGGLPLGLAEARAPFTGPPQAP